MDDAEKIYGPDIGTMKGKTTRKKPIPVKKDEVEIPIELIKKNHHITLCMDIMYVNGLPMLTSIDRTVRFHSLVPLQSRTIERLYEGIDKIIRNYNKAGFQIATIHCDREFEELMDPIKDELEVDMNYTASGEHVPETKRKNRTISERIRNTCPNLPYVTIPKIMLKYWQ